MDNLKLMTRSEYHDWVKSLPVGYCPFCDWTNNEILLEEGKLWIWIASRSPVWRYQTLLVPKRHIRDIIEFTSEELGECLSLYKNIIQKYISLKLVDNEGNPYVKYEMLWRKRLDCHDPVNHIVKPDHFHLNIYPFRDHLYEPKVYDAHLFNIKDILLGGEK